MPYTVLPDAPGGAAPSGGYTVLPDDATPAPPPGFDPGDTIKTMLGASPLGITTDLADMVKAAVTDPAGFLKQFGRTGMLTLRAAAQVVPGLSDALITNPVNAIARHLGAPQPLQPALEVLNRRWDEGGIPAPETPMERIGEAGAIGVGGAGLFGGGIPALISGATSGLSGGSAREMGAGPWAQLLASLGGALAPGALEAGAGAAASFPSRAAARDLTVGRTLNKIAGDTGPLPRAAIAVDKLENAPELVPGSAPTTAAASGNPGLLDVEKTLRSQPGTEFTEADTAANAARQEHIAQVGGTPQKLQSLIDDRSATANADYQTALAQIPNIGPRDQAQFNAIMDRPPFVSAWASAEKNAAGMGMQPQQMDLGNVTFLDMIKKELDAQWQAANRAGDDATARAVQSTKTAFLQTVDNIAPQYPIARGNYAAASEPINRMQAIVGEGGILPKAQTSVTDITSGERVLSPAMWQRALDAVQADPRVWGKLSSQEQQMLLNINADMQRSNAWANVGKTGGSDTYRKFMSGANVSSLLDFLPEAFIPKLAANKLNFTPEVQARFRDAMLDPDLAAQLMRRAMAVPRKTLGDMFGPAAPGFLGGVAASQ